MVPPPEQQDLKKRFRAAYAEHRRREGHTTEQPDQFPYVRSGPLRRMWSVRARSYEKLLASVIIPHEKRLDRRLTILDLGAGNGWLTLRMRNRGHTAVAIDIRTDTVDGLGAARTVAKIAADFTSLPVAAHWADIIVFNASFHYSTSIAQTLREAMRTTRGGGRIVIVDSPFYEREESGAQMVATKRRDASKIFGDLAPELTAIPFIEFLTLDSLKKESEPFAVEWTRHRVRYPLWYEIRPLLARLRGGRKPSRFDVWEGVVPD